MLRSSFKIKNKDKDTYKQVQGREVMGVYEVLNRECLSRLLIAGFIMSWSRVARHVGSGPSGETHSSHDAGSLE